MIYLVKTGQPEVEPLIYMIHYRAPSKLLDGCFWRVISTI